MLMTQKYRFESYFYVKKRHDRGFSRVFIKFGYIRVNGL